MYQENIYNMNFGMQDNMDCDLQSKYFLMLVDNNKQNQIPDNTLLDSAVDQLNDSDELLNLLAAEEDCNAILQNIASSEHFDKLINSDENFQTPDNLNFISNYCDKISYEMPNLEEDEILKSLQQEPIEPPQQILQADASKEEFKCDLCGKLSKNKKLLRYHLKSHNETRPYSCEICDKKFKQRYEVTAHKRSHNKPTFQCDICSKMFIHKSHLNTHRRKHSGDFVDFCKECNKGFVSKSVYKKHVKIQHEKLMHMCDICGQQLSTMSALNEHKNVHVVKERCHVCDICGKSYLSARNLKTHMKIHSLLKNYVCNICGKSLSSKKVLEIHIKSHIGEKDFVCKFCGKTFAANEYLKTHLRTHTGDKPFQCQICDKSFTQRSTLTVHLRYHTGQRPYKCHCGKGFITKSHLMGHYKTHDVPVPELDFSYITEQI